MKLTIRKSRLDGAVSIPASKSHTIRAIAVASLADGKSTIREPLNSNDTQSAVDCYRALGACIDTTDADLWRVKGTRGRISAGPDIIDVGNSGTTLRIAIGSATLAEQNQVVRFTGDEQIRARPVEPLLQSLNDLGANCRSVKNNGCAPVQISGQLRGGDTSIEAYTSQFLSSLLLAAPLASSDSRITVTRLNEPDYVQMTLDWLDKQEIEYENRRFESFQVKGGQRYSGFDERVAADFSSATFFLCGAALLGGQVRLQGLDFSDSQPDKLVVEYLRQMGADVEVQPDAVTVKGSQLRGAEIDMNRTPDALPAMAVIASFARGKSRLVNVAQARQKETDRIKCMAGELRKMGVQVEELPDGLEITGGQAKAAQLHGWADHRIVMALALAAMAVDGESTIDTAEAINITFPTYVKLMKNIGADISTE